MKKIFLLFLITTWLVGSLFIRIYSLEKSPRTVGFDEASLGYNAYSIYLTEKDEYGIKYPLSLRSFNDFKPALYSYTVIPFIKYLGLNQTSTRAPSAVLGTISLFFLLLIFKKVSGASLFTSLVVMVFISFLPWRIHFSRVALESNISMAFFTGLVFFLINFKENIFYKAGVIAFSILAIYSYHSARIAVPILLLLTAVDPITFKLGSFIKKPIDIIKKLWPLFIVTIFYIPLILESKASLLLTRLSQTNVFSHYYPFAPGELKIFDNIWTNLLANPLYYLGGILTGHIFAYLSPKNLSILLYPGVVKSAQVISGSGMLGFTAGIIFIVGLLFSIRSIIKNDDKRIIIYWIISGIIPAAVAWEWFYPLRSLNIYPAIDIIVGLGLLTIIKYIAGYKSRLIKYCTFIVILLVMFSSSVYNVLNEYNYGAWDTSGEFQPGGFKEGIPLLMSLKDNYSVVYLDSNQGQSYILFWFYMAYPPQNIQKIASLRNKPGVEGPADLNFDNFIYKKYDWSQDKYKKDFVHWTNSEVKEDEIKSVPGAKLYKILGPSGNWIASIITME